MKKLLNGALAISGLLLVSGVSQTAYAQDKVLNIYSARHYPGDAQLYEGFTKDTGIQIKRVDADDAGILQRLKAEGSASPADVILLVDASRLWRAEIDGLFAPVQSKLLNAAIPEHLRGKAQPEGTPWFGFSTRARVIVYNKARVQRDNVDTYEELADAKNKGLLCTRSGSHPYNLSLFGAVTEHLGAAAAETWLQGLVNNMARKPVGGDTDQIKAVASGECGIALTNTYYLARLMRSEKPEDRAVMDKVAVVFPNQASWGTHMNPGNAVLFLEYLASAQAQDYFANGNNEWPVAKGVKVANPVLETMAGGSFKAETIPVSVVGMNQVKVQQMLDRVGYK
jgi:iron(III) transport system substrate-binding protein